MRGYDVLRELYHGNLHPSDRGFRDGTVFAAAMEAFTIQENWIRKQLSEEGTQRLDELVSCHNRITDTMSYENFRLGFQLGAMMVMEAVGDSSPILYEL